MKAEGRSPLVLFCLAALLAACTSPPDPDILKREATRASQQTPAFRVAQGDCEKTYQQNKLYSTMGMTDYVRECLFDKNFPRVVPGEFSGVADSHAITAMHDCVQWNIKFYPEKYTTRETCSDLNREQLEKDRKLYARLKAEGKTP